MQRPIVDDHLEACRLYDRVAANVFFTLHKGGREGHFANREHNESKRWEKEKRLGYADELGEDHIAAASWRRVIDNDTASANRVAANVNQRRSSYICVGLHKNKRQERKEYL